MDEDKKIVWKKLYDGEKYTAVIDGVELNVYVDTDAGSISDIYVDDNPISFKPGICVAGAKARACVYYHQKKEARNG